MMMTSRTASASVIGLVCAGVAFVVACGSSDSSSSNADNASSSSGTTSSSSTSSSSGGTSTSSSSSASSGGSTSASSTSSGGGSTTSSSSSSSSSGDGGTTTSSSSTSSSSGNVGTSPVIAGCSIYPANHIFNTPIDTMPVHASSASFMGKIGTENIHLDLGTTTTQSSNDYYGIPYNVVHGNAITWTPIRYYTSVAGYTWNPRTEADCAIGAAHTLISPCTAASAASPIFPIPGAPLVEGGINSTVNQSPDGDHHILILDQDTCKLWETYHSFGDSTTAGTWDVFGTAMFDLKSNALRTADWTSADAAGFPILPLLLRADEASSGKITHALRFTVSPGDIRMAYVWPARHLTDGTTDATYPPMGQLIRLKSSYAIPANYTVQAKAILQAMKTYGMYLADGGSSMYVSGEPSANWQSNTISQVQTVSSTMFEAVDLTTIHNRAGFDVSSGAVPP